MVSIPRVRKRRLYAMFTLLFISIIANVLPPVYAHSSDSSVSTSWFHRVSSASADGSWLWGWAWGADNIVSVVDRSPPVNFVSRPASFGRMIEDVVNGYGIPMNAFTAACSDDEERYRKLGMNDKPNLGCPRLCPSGGHMPEPEENWIAIVQRGNCSFVAKVREAQRFGAKAVIVGGDDPAIGGNPDVLVNMYSQSDASDIKISSTYIKFSDYAHLSNLISSSNTSTSGIKTVSLQITSDYASWEWYSPILTFIVLLLLPSALTLTTLLIHRFRAARAEQRERAPEDVVNRLPWRVWTGSGWEKHEGPVPTKSSADTDLERGEVELELGAPPQKQPQQTHCLPSSSRDDDVEGEGESPAADVESVNPPWFDAQTECAICLSDFVKGDRVRVLPCKHIFHLAEVDEWLIHRKKLCPVCKADVTQPSHPYHHLDHPDSLSETFTVDAPTERTPLLSEQRSDDPPRRSDSSHSQ